MKFVDAVVKALDGEFVTCHGWRGGYMFFNGDDGILYQDYSSPTPTEITPRIAEYWSDRDSWYVL